MKTYQFALLRYVHNVAAEEFVNVGVVMWMPSEQHFSYKLTERFGRLSAFFEGFNTKGYRRMLGEVKKHLREVQSKDLNAESVNDILPLVVPIESGCFQWSVAMGGIALRPEERLDKLFAEFILRHENRNDKPRREEKDILQDFTSGLRRYGLEQRLQRNVEVKGGKFSYKFNFGWQNGKKQVAAPISFDYQNKDDIIEKANKWIGRLYNLRQAEDFAMTGIVAAPQRPELLNAFRDALEMLREAPKVRELVEEAQLEHFIPKIERDLEAH